MSDVSPLDALDGPRALVCRSLHKWQSPRPQPRFRAAFADSFTVWPARNLCFAITWPCGRMRVAPGAARRLHQQATIVAANTAVGMTSLCPQPSEWTGTALAADVYPGSAVSSERFSREEKEMRLFPQSLVAAILTAGCYLSNPTF